MFHKQSCQVLSGKEKKKEKDCHEELFSDFSKQNRNMSLAKAVTLSQPLYMGYFYCENR